MKDFEEFHKRNSRKIYYLCYRYYKNSHDVKDIVQDIYIKFLNKYHLFNGDSSIETFFYRIAINHLVDLSRKRKYYFLDIQDVNLYEAESDTENISISYASLLFSHGYFAEADDVLCQQLLASKKAHQAMRLLAEFANRLGRNQEAEKWRRRLHQEIPDDLNVLFQLADGAASSSLRQAEIWLEKIQQVVNKNDSSKKELESVNLFSSLVRARALFAPAPRQESPLRYRRLRLPGAGVERGPVPGRQAVAAHAVRRNARQRADRLQPARGGEPARRPRLCQRLLQDQ